MKIYRLIGIIILTQLLCNCVSFSKKLSFKDKKSLKQKEIKLVEGEYELKPFINYRKYDGGKPTIIDSLPGYNLYYALNSGVNKIEVDNQDVKKYSLKIHCFDSKNLLISLVENFIVVDSFKLGYTYKNNGYLKLDNSYFIVNNVPLIYGGFETGKSRITVDGEGNLILNESDFLYGAVLMIFGDTRSTKNSYKFKKL